MSKHELRMQVQSKVRQLMREQQHNRKQAKTSRKLLQEQLGTGVSNGGVGRSSGGGTTSSRMKGVFDYSSTDDDSSGARITHLDLDDTVLEPEEAMLKKALGDSMHEVKKCREALNVASGVVLELKNKNKVLVKQSFRRNMYRSRMGFEEN